MRHWPLRWQLALLTMCLVAAVLAGAGTAASWHSYHEGVADMDEDIQAVSRGLFSTMEFAGPGFAWSNRAALRDALPASHHLYLLDISTLQGMPLFRSRELAEQSIPIPPVIPNSA